MPKPKQQLPPADLVTLKPCHCSTCHKLLGYYPVGVPEPKHKYIVEPLIFCSEDCALRELEPEIAKLYRYRKKEDAKDVS